MGDHDAPVSWLERWQATEPLRLYLYGITVPMLGVAIVYGWMTTEQMGAWLAVAGALFIGSTVAGELARRKVTPVDGPVLSHWMDEIHAASYASGVEDALHTTPDAVANLATTAMRTVRPADTRCRYIENGRRCVLDPHEEGMPHHYG
jgi:hypothetical protein